MLQRNETSSGGNANFNWLRGLFLNGVATSTGFNIRDFNGEGCKRAYIAIGSWK